MATIPTTPGFANVEAGYRRSAAKTESPYTFAAQIHANAGIQKQMTCTLPPLTSSQAETWTAFLKAVSGGIDTFTMDVSKYYPDEPGVSAVSFRLSANEVTWSVNTIKHFGISFVVEEVV